MNNVTEEIQCLLDERKVKYRLVKELGKDTFYLNWSDHCGGYTKAICVEGACVTAEISYLTPEEAIAATLSGGKLTAEQVRELIVPHLNARPTFDFGRHGAVWSADFQAIADTLNATLGGGECVPHGEWIRISQTQEARHVYCECGYELGVDRRDSFPFKHTQLFTMTNYCPNCGRKIQREMER